MRKILLLVPILLMFIQIKAMNIVTVNLPSGNNFITNSNAATKIELNFQIGRSAYEKSTQFKVQVIYFPLTGKPEVVSETGYDSFDTREKISFVWSSYISGTLAVGKSKGQIGLRLISKTNTGSEAIDDSMTKFSLVDLSQNPDPNPNPNPNPDPNPNPNPNPKPPRVINPFTSIYGVNGRLKYNVRTLPYQGTPIPGTPGVLRPTNGPVLTSGNAIFSPNGQYNLNLQTDGSLVLYSINGQILWSADTYQKGGKYLFFQADGNLVLSKNLDGSGVVWSSDIYAPSANFIRDGRLFYSLQNDGNFVMYFDGQLLNSPSDSYTAILGDTGTDGGRKSSHFKVINYK